MIDWNVLLFSFLFVSFWITLLFYVKERDGRKPIENLFTVLCLDLIVYFAVIVLMKIFEVTK